MPSAETTGVNERSGSASPTTFGSSDAVMTRTPSPPPTRIAPSRHGATNTGVWLFEGGSARGVPSSGENAVTSQEVVATRKPSGEPSGACDGGAESSRFQRNTPVAASQA